NAPYSPISPKTTSAKMSMPPTLLPSPVSAEHAPVLIHPERLIDQVRRVCWCRRARFRRLLLRSFRYPRRVVADPVPYIGQTQCVAKTGRSIPGCLDHIDPDPRKQRAQDETQPKEDQRAGHDIVGDRTGEYQPDKSDLDHRHRRDDQRPDPDPTLRPEPDTTGILAVRPAGLATQPVQITRIKHKCEQKHRKDLHHGRVEVTRHEVSPSSSTSSWAGRISGSRRRQPGCG